MVIDDKTNDNEEISTLKVGTGWLYIEILSEPDVILTFRGYAPILKVKVLKSGITKILYISAKSLSSKLEDFRKSNKGKFSGLRIKICKASTEKTSKYLLDLVDHE